MKKYNPNTVQSPLARARGYGSAKEGSHHWMAQRITAIALIPLVIWFVWSVISLQSADFATFTTWLSNPVHAVAMILFIIATTYHAVLGAQVIVEDYIHCECFKMVKLIGNKLFFTALAIATIFAIMKVAFA
jgi:succinate dehydrogenase / fumarate reductase membrane anchor subunit